MNIVHFVRHGENPANLTREFSHRVVDYPLTERGVAQARATARYFAGHEIAAVYASPLRRAAQTADIIAETLGLPVQTVEAFREVNVGALELEPPSEANWALHDRIFADWFGGQASSCFPDGEDHITLVERMQAGLVEALRDRDEQEIIIVAHGGALAATIGAFCHNAPTFPQNIRTFSPTLGQASLMIPNCAITRLALDMRDDTVHGTVEAWAECGHLDDLDGCG